jgi:hypothetical protein
MARARPLSYYLPVRNIFLHSMMCRRAFDRYVEVNHNIEFGGSAPNPPPCSAMPTAFRPRCHRARTKKHVRSRATERASPLSTYLTEVLDGQMSARVIPAVDAVRLIKTANNLKTNTVAMAAKSSLVWFILPICKESKQAHCALEALRNKSYIFFATAKIVTIFNILLSSIYNHNYSYGRIWTITRRA